MDYVISGKKSAHVKYNVPLVTTGFEKRINGLTRMPSNKGDIEPWR